MAILDLLASITGEKPTPSRNPAPRPSATLSKRKAEDELRPAAAKSARIQATTDRSLQPGTNPPKALPRLADRALGSSSNRASSLSRASFAKPISDVKRGPAGVKRGNTGTPSANGTKPLPSQPLANHPTPTDAGPPKKRSFAEIMARAKANSGQRESLGMIHHKTIERNMTMKERKELKAEGARKARMAARKGASGRSATAAALVRHGGANSAPVRNAVSSSSASVKSAAAVEEKKVKKAALATTGYTGTARPRVSTSTAAKPGAASRASSGAQTRDGSRHGGPLSGSRNRRYEDEDDDMEGFIEYDEEEEVPGYDKGARNRYDSYEDESDMEAGLSDIEDEELEADRHARREDQEQEFLEKKLKRQKEERRRKHERELRQASKSKARGR